MMPTIHKRILVTGVAGFIGSNLADRLLEERYEVIGIDNLSYGLIEQVPPAVDFHELDIRSKLIFPLFEGVDTVFHMAAKNCIEDCQNDPVETVSNNVVGLVNVFEAAKRAKVRKVVYAESSAIYEGSTLLPTPEYDEHPRSFYALSKSAGRLFAAGYERYWNVTTTALRYFCVYGPRQDYRRTMPPVMSSFIIHILKGTRPVIYGTGEKRRDFVHVDDINNFHIQCINDTRTDYRVFNLGSGVNYSVNEILDIIKRLLNSDVEPIFKPDMIGEATTTLAEIFEANQLGWKPSVNLDDGLRQMIDFIKENVDLT
jgi:nucleoside-diphosphate-sugar epimerase